MRRLLTLSVLALAFVAPFPATASTTFVFFGAGWGHGIGMAQYGAYGFAQHGWTYDEILAHYYSGTTLGRASTSRIRVLLASGKSLEIGSDAPFSVTDAAGRIELPAGTVRIGAGLRLEVDGERRKLEGPIRFRPGKKPLRLGRPYRGTIVVTPADGKLLAVNDLKLEQYLRGVVAGEMPPDWHPEALKAQAVAARTYALASRESEGPFDVFSDTRDQVYGGIETEDARTNAAVTATGGEVVLYEGEIAWTFFSASSGGKTAAIEDVFVGAEPLPYLVSVDDPYDTISPYHRWGPLTFTAKQLKARLGSRLPAGLTDLEVNVNASGRVASVTAHGSGGATKEIGGPTMRALLGLRSTWFSIATQDELVVSTNRLVFGQRVTLSGYSPDRSEVTIEQRPEGGTWETLATVAVRDDGSFSARARPQTTTAYRLRLGSKAGAPVRVVVAPKVTLSEAAKPGALTGTIKPILAGAEVTIQRRAQSSWKAVAFAAVDGDGGFRAAFDVTPGVYRARVAPGAGLAAGTSRPLAIGAG
jgi:stage II sporulation protein D